MAFNINDLKPNEGSTSRRKRLGRGNGSGSGTTAGRGTKGQNSRTGGGVRPGFEGGQLPIQRRMPFKRGFTNIYKTPWEIVNLQDIEDAGFSGTVTPEDLESIGLIRGADFPVKILAGGEFSTKIEVQAHGFSKSARERIEAAGGTVTELERTDRWVTASPRSRRLPINRDLKQARLGKVGGIDKVSELSDS